MIVVVCSRRYDPSDRADVLASLAEVTAASRRDAGCAEYSWAGDLEAPNTLRFLECWESQELLDAHLAEPHEAAFGERNLGRLTSATAGMDAASPADGSERPPAG